MLLIGCDSAPDTSTFHSGSHVTLQCSANNVVVARRKEELDRITEFAVGNDEKGIALEVIADRAFIVPNGTKSTVTSVSYTVSQVRIEEGDMENQSGWIPNEWIKLQ